MKIKIFRFLSISLLTIGLSNLAFADKVIIEQTEGWSSVPIVVDVEKQTYTSPHYYYSYKGHRCFIETKTFAGIDAIIFHAGIDGGVNIYCYPED